MSVTHKIQTSISSDSGALGIAGYDNETGATEITVTNNYPASSSNTAWALALTAANLQSVFLLSDKGCTITTNGTGTADVQTIAITGTPTGGDFPIQFKGQVTELPYNAAAAAVQTALQALATIGSGNVLCTGGPLPGTPVVCTFAGALAIGLQPLMTVFSGALTGGSGPAVAVTHTTPGLPQDTIVLSPGSPLAWGKSNGYGSCPFAGNVTQAYVTCTAAMRLQGRILTS
jgi:hypothetical protein